MAIPETGDSRVAIYDLADLCILVVDDNAFIRNVLESLLRQFRVGRVITAGSGEEAIDSLKVGGATIAVDIVMADLIMSPINGMLMLRWARNAPESPNRFIPFVMVSGAADQENVVAARDHGVTEFLAKPYSAANVYRRLLEVIDRPRQFVATNTYFGPDRRRRDIGVRGIEQRRTREEDVTIVRSGGEVVQPSSSSGVWYFRLPNNLRAKVGGSLAGRSAGGEIPMALLEQAEAELQRAAFDFTEWARRYIADLTSLCDEAMKQAGSRVKQFESINLIAHELRGQGGTFGYPLITTFAKMLYSATGDGRREDDNGVEIVQAHVDAMRAVIRDKVSGDGGEAGRALTAGLRAAIEKQSKVS